MDPIRRQAIDPTCIYNTIVQFELVNYLMGEFGQPLSNIIKQKVSGQVVPIIPDKFVAAALNLAHPRLETFN